MTRKNRDHDLWPKGRWQPRRRVQDRQGEALAISIPGSEAGVIRHFQERMPSGLFVPEVGGE
jgi:hypothetical protein